VLLSLTLNNLRSNRGDEKKDSCNGFIETKDFRVCRGPYDPCLISAWEDYDAKCGSENDHPKDFTSEQSYIVFVLADGGTDLESFALVDYNEARSLLVQVTASLAVAESACEFEHRDLHWFVLSPQLWLIHVFNLDSQSQYRSIYNETRASIYDKIEKIHLLLKYINFHSTMLF